jgi:hypothetical protein
VTAEFFSVLPCAVIETHVGWQDEFEQTLMNRIVQPEGTVVSYLTPITGWVPSLFHMYCLSNFSEGDIELGK